MSTQSARVTPITVMSIVRLVVAIVLSPLAVYRLVVLVRDDEGPFSVMHALRERNKQDTWVGRGLHCPSCLSFWFGPLVVILSQNAIGQLLVSGLGLSGLVVWFYRRGVF